MYGRNTQWKRWMTNPYSESGVSELVVNTVSDKLCTYKQILKIFSNENKMASKRHKILSGKIRSALTQNLAG